MWITLQACLEKAWKGTWGAVSELRLQAGFTNILPHLSSGQAIGQVAHTVTLDSPLGLWDPIKPMLPCSQPSSFRLSWMNLQTEHRPKFKSVSMNSAAVLVQSNSRTASWTWRGKPMQPQELGKERTATWRNRSQSEEGRKWWARTRTEVKDG